MKKSLIILSLCCIIAVPQIATAKDSLPIYLSLFAKINELTRFDTIVATKIREIPYFTENSTPEEIIDSYSGIKITFGPTTVYFSYLGETEPPTKINNADPHTFQLIETGSEIIATDKQALYIIYGEDQIRVTDIDLQSLQIIYKGNHAEKKYLQDKDQAYRIEGLDLIPVTLLNQEN